MKNKPTDKQIAAEIAALKIIKLRTVGFAATEDIETAIDTLEGQVDETAEEFEELTESQRDIYFSATRWLDGEDTHKPSEEFA